MKYTHKVVCTNSGEEEWWFARLDGNKLSCSPIHREDGTEYDSKGPYFLEGKCSGVADFYGGFDGYTTTRLNEFRGNVD